MATLKLIALDCIRRHDLTGVDEPVILVNNITVWNGVMNKGESEQLTGGRTEEVPFEGTIPMRLEERSNGYGTQIGITHIVRPNPTANGLAVYKNSGTHYELSYRVVG